MSQEFFGNQLELMKLKGIYPYKCIHRNDIEKYDGANLSKEESFYNSLRDEYIIDKDYVYVKMFGMN